MGTGLQKFEKYLELRVLQIKNNNNNLKSHWRFYQTKKKPNVSFKIKNQTTPI
jgi:hypothetical protein